jgi:predicted DNA-binding transcriptional regulator AlpA
MKPYYTMPELADLLSMSRKGLLNAVSRGDFPIPTYKLGKLRVADKQVVEFYFEQKRAEGLSAITTKS